MRYVIYIRIIGLALILSLGGVSSDENDEINNWRREANVPISFLNLDDGNDDPTVSCII